MYHRKRSIRRRAVGCAGLVFLILVVASTSRCTSDSITGGENPSPEVPGPGNPGPANPDPVDTQLGVGSVTLSPDSLTVAVEETAQLSVIVRDTDGAVIPNPQVVFTGSGLQHGTVDSNGLVTGLAPGVGTVVAWSGGVNSKAAVITVPSDVGSVTLSPATHDDWLRIDGNSLYLLGGHTAQLTVVVRDTAGAVIANPRVDYLVQGLTAGAVDSSGLVTARPRDYCSVGSVIARSGGMISNRLYITVTLPSGAGCWDY